MTIPKSVESASTAGFLSGWVRAIASRFAGSGELQNLGSKEFEQIARDLNLSSSELFALSTRNDPSGDLLRKRIAECGLSTDELKTRQPEVLRDLERVCGHCTSTKRCGAEFRRGVAPPAHRSDYCPNAPTLQALMDEDRQSRLQASLPLGPSCC
jgi:hypothetical protein